MSILSNSSTQISSPAIPPSISKKSTSFARTSNQNMLASDVHTWACFEEQKKYKRIPNNRRNLLLEKIFFENKKIKIAAQEMNMNYSSAKTILHLYRKKAKRAGRGQIANLQETSRCSYMFSSTSLNQSSSQTSSPMQIMVSQGGRLTSVITAAPMSTLIIPLTEKTCQKQFSQNLNENSYPEDSQNTLQSEYQKQRMCLQKNLSLQQLQELFNLSTPQAHSFSY